MYLSKKTILEAFDAYVELNEIKLKSILDTALQELVLHKNSSALFHIRFLKFMYSALVDFNIDSDFDVDFEEYRNVFNLQENIIFHIVHAQKDLGLRRLNESMHCLEVAENLCMGLNNAAFLATIYHIKSIIYKIQNKPYLTYIYAQKALNLLNMTTYFERMKFVHICVANSYIQMKMFDKAKETYLSLLNHLKSNEIELITRILDNLSWCCLKSKNYQEAIDYAKKSIEKGSTFDELYLNIPLALFFQKKYDSCLEKTEFAIQKNNSHFLCDLLRMIKFYILQDEK